jgi:uncharacterized protein (DUF1015 family)
MAIVKPFKGLRPAPEYATQVASLPYDVMDSDEAREIVRQNPNSFLKVTKAEVDLPEDCDVHSAAVYRKAKENLNEFIAKGLLRQDQTACFYIYKQKMGDHEQIGLAAVVSVDEYEQGIIKKHELTRPDKEQDRVDHILATGAQTGSVFLTYREDAKINELITAVISKRPAVEFTAGDGISHSLYIVDDPGQTAQLEQAFAALDVLYIADGHHRSAAAARVRDSLRRQNPNHTGQEDYNYFLAVAFPHTMMKIMDYNRVVCDLAGLTEQEFFARVSGKFDIANWGQGAMKPDQAQTFGMYLTGRWYKLTAKPEAVPADDLTGRLDVSILQDNLLAPILGINDVRTDKRIAFVGGIRGMSELEKLVDSGRYAVAFSLYPTAIEDLMAIADAGEIMPPKSTWFEPKLRDAMVVHVIKE